MSARKQPEGPNSKLELACGLTEEVEQPRFGFPIPATFRGNGQPGSADAPPLDAACVSEVTADRVGWP